MTGPRALGGNGLDLLGDLLGDVVGAGAPCMAISLVMSPWTLILPHMKACIAAAWS